MQLPSTVSPFLTVMLPDGVPVAAATVAVNVTELPVVDGLLDEVRVVVVAMASALT